MDDAGRRFERTADLLSAARATRRSDPADLPLASHRVLDGQPFAPRDRAATEPPSAWRACVCDSNCSMALE